jgi:hypothetical protein
MINCVFAIALKFYIFSIYILASFTLITSNKLRFQILAGKDILHEFSVFLHIFELAFLHINPDPRERRHPEYFVTNFIPNTLHFSSTLKRHFVYSLGNRMIMLSFSLF